MNQLVVSQGADWSSRRLDDSRTSQLAKTFEAKFGVENLSKCDNYKFAVSELTSP